MKHKQLNFNDPTEFNIIVKQIRKQIKSEYETLSATYFTDRKAGDIELKVFNDISSDFAFNEVLHITSEKGFMVLNDGGDAYKVVNDIYKDKHGNDIDPIILTRLYKDTVKQYQRQSNVEPIISYDATIPVILMPFKMVSEIKPVLDQMNMLYFLLSRNTNQL
ncbi:hypothetical protein [Nicoliella lavandulae]|uniref:Uncharacterized protein n=1 Tax=Nicoliella lavandulae TaxID=3082954 RepID=A0ABU8SM18_9LACO